MIKEIIYYTCNTHDQKIEDACRTQLLKAGLPIISVSLNKEINFGDQRLNISGEKSPQMMHRQILMGLQASTAKYVFLCESDVLYHPSHFEFTPFKNDTFFYNVNVWKFHTDDRKFYWTDDLQQVSGTIVNRELAIKFYERRVAEMVEHDFDGHYEAGKKTGEKAMNWKSDLPNICIRHENTMTKTKKSPDEFRNKQYAKGFKVADRIEGWADIDIIL